MSGDQGALFVPRTHAGQVLGFEPAELPPAARLTDPLPSHLAEAKVTARGDRSRDMGLVAGVVAREPGLTYREIHSRLELQIAEASTIAKRLADLEKAGAVEKGPRRKCRVGGNPCTTWNPKG